MPVSSILPFFFLLLNFPGTSELLSYLIANFTKLNKMPPTANFINMYSESIKKDVNYKLRELELIIKQLDSDNEPSRIDIDLALEKTRQLYELLLILSAGSMKEPRGEKSIPTGKPVVPSDPDPVEDNSVYEAEGIIPSPLQFIDSDERQPDKSDKETEKFKADKKEDAGSEHSDKPPSARTDPAESAENTPPATENNVAEEKFGDKPPSARTDPAEKREPAPEKGHSAKSDASAAKGPEASQDWIESKTQNRPTEIGIVAEKYQTSQNYINQAIASKQTKKDLTTKLQSMPIADLRSSIGLNDKFLFIKEIFRGRPDIYSQCIDEMNNSASYGEALEHLRDKYSLDENNEVVKKLLTLVKRKHKAE